MEFTHLGQADTCCIERSIHWKLRTTPLKIGRQASDTELRGKADSWTLSTCVGLKLRRNQTVVVKDGGKCFCYFMHILGKRSMGGPHFWLKTGFYVRIHSHRVLFSPKSMSKSPFPVLVWMWLVFFCRVAKGIEHSQVRLGRWTGDEELPLEGLNTCLSQ